MILIGWSGNLSADCAAVSVAAKASASSATLVCKRMSCPSDNGLSAPFSVPLWPVHGKPIHDVRWSPDRTPLEPAMSQTAEKVAKKPATVLKDTDFNWEDPLDLEGELTEEER